MRRLLLLAAVTLVASACHQRTRRTAGDEIPYPALDEAALDRNALPCQDFYQFACGRWASEVPAPPDRKGWTRGTGEVEERNARLMRRILEEAGAGKVEAQERFGRKAGDFYAACMDEAGVEASGLAELQAEWARLDAISDRMELADELSRLEAMGLGVPFGVSTRPDPASAAHDLLLLAAGAEGVAPRDEDGGTAEARALQGSPDAGQGGTDPFLEHVRAMLRLGGFPPAQVEEEAAAAVGLQRAIAGAPTTPPVGPGTEPRRLDRAGLQRLAPQFPWGRLLRALGAERLNAFGADEPFVGRVGQAFEQAPVADWKAYLRFRLAEAMAAERALPARLVQEWFRFLGAPAPPLPAELRPRWKHCVDATVRTFPFAAGGAFARRHLGTSGRDRAGWLVSDLQRGMLVTVESAPWIDAATQSRAAGKLDRMVVQIGFPDADAGADYRALRVSRDSYFRNVLSAGRFEVAREVARASRPVDRGEWLAGPFAPRPGYWPARNVLCVPAGALQPPVYNLEAPDPVVFGAMGTSIGRALAGALEGSGRLRGQDGTPGDWWTPAAARGFEARTACLVEQYGAYESAGAQLDGRGTLPGNLADLAGLRAAYEAMRAERIAHPGPEKKVLGFTADQQFFLGYAQTLCTAAEPGGEAANGGRPPARFRVNGPLSNLPEFARAFRCAEGSPLARPARARCDVW